MRLAFVVYKYFPYGGMQRDLHRIVQLLGQRGHDCRVYCIAWQGERLPGVDPRLLPVTALSNVGRYQRFARAVQADLAADPVDGVIGFNKMPGLDIYFAADPCYLDRALRERSWLYRLGRRFRHFARWERAVFAPGSGTEILLLTATEQRKFEQHYRTPPARLHLLPAGVALDRKAPPDATVRRREVRANLGLAQDDLVLLLVGSGYITKGLDRALHGLAGLHDKPGGQRARLLVVGQDREHRFRRQAQRLGLGEQVAFLGGRDDVPALLLAADLLVHPARSEAAGIVLLEALVAGLPVVVTAVCGYAHHIEAAGAGVVLATPFNQGQLDAALARMLDGDCRARCSRAALAYAAREDLYSMHSSGADLIEQIIQHKVGRKSGCGNG